MGASLTKLRIFFLNIGKFSELRMAGSSLFHSEIVYNVYDVYVLHWKWEWCVHFLKYKMNAWQELNGKGIEDAHF